MPEVAANDNRTPAGQLKNHVLNLQLELCQGRWYPEDEGGGYRDVYAFAEEGHTPQSSGPLIRVPQGRRFTPPSVTRCPWLPKSTVCIAIPEMRRMR
ncbi:MAG: hypothetical protein WB660_25045 [Candidatus Sulfotelmatobacter sp.]